MMATRLPQGISACLFDLDGVLTQTAVLHAEAWKRTFDEFLQGIASSSRSGFLPFDSRSDFERYVDGRPRLDGTREFLRSRGIALPDGDPADPPGAHTVHGLARRKNDLVLELMRERGVTVYPGSLRFLAECRSSGLRTAVVSSSANAPQVLEVANIVRLFDVRVDGMTVEAEHLRGKPAPDSYLAAAHRLGVPAGSAAVFEDALAGVEAGRAGGFGYVVGVDRIGQADALRERGADIVVTDLGELIR